jgi:hypothetical protein
MLTAPKARPLLLIIALCVIALGGVAPAGAQPAPVGTVEALVGTAVVTRRATGEALPLTVGVELFEADRVRTEVGARLRLRLRDGSVLTCGEATGLILEEAVYAPARPARASCCAYRSASFGRSSISWRHNPATRCTPIPP